MSEAGRIEDQLRRAFEGEAWHGPSLRELLADVNADQAAARPIAGAHTIWEIVLHIGAWEGVALKRLQEDFESLPDDENFPIVTDASAAAWNDVVTRFEEQNRQLRRAIADFDENRLDEVVGNTDTSYYGILHGVIQHGLYHGGQIALLRKALAV
jgi:uncharacterized damage-inducible protein DinB